MNQLQPEPIYHSSPNAVASEAGNGLLVYDQNTGSVHHLNRTARFVWEYCSEPRTLREIVSELQSRYPGVSRQTLEADLLETVSDFAAKGLLQDQ